LNEKFALTANWQMQSMEHLAKQQSAQDQAKTEPGGRITAQGGSCQEAGIQPE